VLPVRRRARVPDPGERLQATATGVDQVLLQGRDAEGVGHAQDLRRVRAHAHLEGVARRVAHRSHGLRAVAQLTPVEGREHRRTVGHLHGQRVVRTAPGVVGLGVAIGARGAADEDRLGRRDRPYRVVEDEGDDRLVEGLGIGLRAGAEVGDHDGPVDARLPAVAVLELAQRLGVHEGDHLRALLHAELQAGRAGDHAVVAADRAAFAQHALAVFGAEPDAALVDALEDQHAGRAAKDAAGRGLRIVEALQHAVAVALQLARAGGTRAGGGQRGEQEGGESEDPAHGGLLEPMDERALSAVSG